MHACKQVMKAISSIAISRGTPPSLGSSFSTDGHVTKKPIDKNKRHSEALSIDKGVNTRWVGYASDVLVAVCTMYVPSVCAVSCANRTREHNFVALKAWVE